jgi:hypothetical protein
LVLHGIENHVGDGSRIMRLGIEQSIMAVGFGVFFKPFLSVEILGPYPLISLLYTSLFDFEFRYLLHILKHLLTTPARHVPIVIVLWCTTDAKRSVHTT